MRIPGMKKISSELYLKRDMDELSFEKLFHAQQYMKTSPTSISEETWHDLELSKVYDKLNYTLTTPGEEILMAMMMHQASDLNAHQEKVAYNNRFEEKNLDGEKLRKDLQKVGYTQFDYRTLLRKSSEGIPKNTLKVTLMMIVLGLGIFSMMYFKSGFALIFLSLVLVGIMTYHYTWMGKNRTYLRVFSYMTLLSDFYFRHLETLEYVENRDLSHVTEYAKAILKYKKLLNKLEGLNPLQDIFDVITLRTERGFDKITKKVLDDPYCASQLIDIIGRLDAAHGLKYFKDHHDGWVEPKFNEDGELYIEDVYNPIIENCVCNNLELGDSMVITGSNMSGKSTYLRTVGINVVLAQGLNMAFAKSYSGSFFKVITSISLSDDISSGKSFFMMEAEALKIMLDGVTEPVTHLLLIDEILKGTNPQERLAASVVILNTLEKTEKVIVTTHDIGILPDLKHYRPYHLEHHVTEHAIQYDYDLKPGVAHTRNAIKIMSFLKYPSSIIDEINAIVKSS